MAPVFGLISVAVLVIGTVSGDLLSMIQTNLGYYRPGLNTNAQPAVVAAAPIVPPASSTTGPVVKLGAYQMTGTPSVGDKAPVGYSYLGIQYATAKRFEVREAILAKIKKKYLAIDQF